MNHGTPITVTEAKALMADIRDLRAKVRAARDGRCRLVATIERKEVGGVTLLTGVFEGYEFNFIESDFAE